MRDAVGLIQAVVRDQLRGFRTAELAVVTAVHSHASASDLNNHECDVRLRDSGAELRRVAVATGRMGAALLPAVDDLVLVQFLHGDVHSAVVTGCLYNDTDRPPTATAREAVYVSPHAAEQGVRRLYVELPNGNKLTLTDDEVKLEMGSTTLTIANGGDVSVASSAKVTITSSGDASVESRGALALKATGDVSIEGMNVTVKAQVAASLEGGATSTVKGPMVKLAGKTDFAPA